LDGARNWPCKQSVPALVNGRMEFGYFPKLGLAGRTRVFGPKGQESIAQGLPGQTPGKPWYVFSVVVPILLVVVVVGCFPGC
jgi:hypothetical protein